MQAISREFLQYLSNQFQIDDSAPSAVVYLYHPITGERMQMDRIISVDIDRRFDAPAGEFNFEADNTGGWLSPDFNPFKFPEQIELQGTGGKDSPWEGVLLPNTKVEIYMGYGDQLIKMMTGLIDTVVITAEKSSIAIKGRSMYKRLIVQTIQLQRSHFHHVGLGDLGITKYQNYTVKQIVQDMHDMCQLPLIADEIYVDGTNIPYVVPELSVGRSMTYEMAIQEIMTASFARLFALPDGTMRLTGSRTYNAADEPDVVFDEYVNLTSLGYTIEDLDVRNTLLIRGTGGAVGRFTDDFLLNTVCRGQVREDIVDVPWADTPVKRQQAAKAAFRRYRQKLRTMTIASVGNPSLELYDLARIHEHVSTATQKYLIKGIRTTFSAQGLFDLIEMEVA